MYIFDPDEGAPVTVGNYKKLIAAVVGVGALFATKYLGLDADAEQLTEAILSILTMFGVYQLRNVPPGTDRNAI